METIFSKKAHRQNIHSFQSEYLPFEKAAQYVAF